MELVLLTSDDCPICDEAVEKFKKSFWKELDNGEAKVVNLDQDEDAQELFLENDLPLAPIVVLVTKNKRVVSHIEPSDLLDGLNEASPAPEADRAAIESSGDSK